MQGQAGRGVRTQEGRRWLRRELTVRITLQSDRLIEWPGKVVTLDRFRVKMRLVAKKSGPPEGSNVWLQFSSLPGQSSAPVGGMVSQVDPDGLITVLPSLSTQEFHRLKSLTNASSGDQTPSVQRRAEASSALSPVQAEPVGPRAYEEAPAPIASRHQVDDEGAEGSVTRDGRERAFLPDATASVQQRAEASASSPDGQAEAPSTPRAYEEAPAPTASRHQVDDEGVEDRLKGLEGRLKSLLTGDQPLSFQRRPEAPASSPARQAEMPAAQGRDEGAPSPSASRQRVEGEDFEERLLKSAEERFKSLMDTFLGDQTPSLQRRPEASASSSARQAEAPAAQRAYERTQGLNASRHRIEGETTREERERALLALIQEGRSMLPSKSELMAKVEEIKRKGNKERPSASTKKRGRRGTG